MTLIAILLGTLVAGIGSVWLAAALSFGALARYTQHMLSLAAGALISPKIRAWWGRKPVQLSE